MSSVNSPCVRNCCLDEDEICLGCFRSMQEIMQWGQAADQQKMHILELAKSRQIDHQLKYSQTSKIDDVNIDTDNQ